MPKFTTPPAVRERICALAHTMSIRAIVQQLEDEGTKIAKDTVMRIVRASGVTKQTSNTELAETPTEDDVGPEISAEYRVLDAIEYQLNALRLGLHADGTPRKPDEPHLDVKDYLGVVDRLVKVVETKLKYSPSSAHSRAADAVASFAELMVSATQAEGGMKLAAGAMLAVEATIGRQEDSIEAEYTVEDASISAEGTPPPAGQGAELNNG